MSIKTATKIKAMVLSIKCPECGYTQIDFVGDPRGDKVLCECCGNEFLIATDAEIELEKLTKLFEGE